MSGNENIISDNNQQSEQSDQQLPFTQLLRNEPNTQDNLNMEILENQRKLLAELELVRNDIEIMKEVQKCQFAEPVKNIIQAPIVPKNNQTTIPTSSSKFVVKHVFKNISKLVTDKFNESENEEHFGVPWHLNIVRKEPFLGAYLRCDKPESCKRWLIDTNYDLKFVHPTGKSHLKNRERCFVKKQGFGFSKFIEWEDMVKDYLVDDKLIVEAHVNITKMTGVYKNNLRSFDSSASEISDVILTVQEEKFYVSKLFLATHSSYFKTLFLGNFNESKKTEVVLSGIDAFDFQNYLEVLYGDYAIDEMTVEGILLVGDMFDTEIVTRKCEEFLMEKSKKLLKKKLQMAVRYNLEGLK